MVLTNSIFTDKDNDSLSYTVMLANKSLIPSWLAFNNFTQTFEGTPLSIPAFIYKSKFFYFKNIKEIHNIFYLF